MRSAILFAAALIDAVCNAWCLPARRDMPVTRACLRLMQ